MVGIHVAFTTTSPARYLETIEWLNEIGEVWVAFADPQGVTRHVLFAGGLDAGIAPLPHTALRVLPYVLKLRARFPRMFGSSRGRSVTRSNDRSTRFLRTAAEVPDCSSIRIGWVRAFSRRCHTIRLPGRCPQPGEVSRRGERVLVPDDLERETSPAWRALGGQDHGLRRPDEDSLAPHD